MKGITRYICVKKVCKVTGLAFFVIFFVVAWATVWNFTQESKSSKTKNIIQVLRDRGIHFSFPENGSQPYINDSRITGTGFVRAQKVQEICHRMKAKICGKRRRRGSYCSVEKKFRVDFNRQQRAMFCPMCKMASTFWTRVFRMMSLNTGSANHRIKILRTPYDIPIADAPQSKLYYNANENIVLDNDLVEFKFLFVRNPFSMLFATYVDKIIGPNPVYWGQYGTEVNNRLHKKNANICGADISFQEFLNHVIHTHKSGKYLDCHFAKYSVCNPCKIQYDFIGKMETFKSDTYDILTIFNQSSTIEAFENDYDELHAYDAIEDSVKGPFEWKEDIVKCITWHEALKRIHRKLQIRGIIGLSPFPLTQSDSEKISDKEFISLMMELRSKSDHIGRKILKKRAYIETYRNTSKKLLEGVRDVYREEFEIFEYDINPFPQNSNL